MAANAKYSSILRYFSKSYFPGALNAKNNQNTAAQNVFKGALENFGFLLVIYSIFFYNRLGRSRNSCVKINIASNTIFRKLMCITIKIITMNIGY